MQDTRCKLQVKKKLSVYQLKAIFDIGYVVSSINKIKDVLVVGYMVPRNYLK